jgi:hypothetical protein
MVVSEMRRDSNSVWQNENFLFAFDTFYDRRNSATFQFNPIGGRMDGQVTNENQTNFDFNPIWSLAVRQVEGGWTGEAAVPFKSLRFKPGPAQVWGFQTRRVNKWKNEISFLTSLPAGQGIAGYQRVSRYATMVGLEVPSGSRALDVKPFVTADVRTDLTAIPGVHNDAGGAFGFDAKYSLTPNLTADFTYNTDFAQVEADEQQVNLTRFSLFFPEKREFFLENQGLFSFASSGGTTGANQNPDTPTLFYSRNIGLDAGREVPIDAGGRLSGRMGRYTVGLLNIQSGAVERFGIQPVNVSVARVKRDILRRSSVGMLYTRRSLAKLGSGEATTYGVDSLLSFYQNLYINSYWARTETPGVRADDTSYRTQLSYTGDRYAVQLERLLVGDGFDPQLGFVRRDDFLKHGVLFRFSPRPRNRFTSVRKFGYQWSLNYFENGARQLETRQHEGVFYMDFQSGDRLQFNYADGYELLTQPFAISSGVTIPAGGYDVRTFTGELRFGQQRAASGALAVEAGPFYGGTRTAFSYSNARVSFTRHFAIDPSVSIDRVRLPHGNFTSRLIGSRATYTVTPLMFVSMLLQYNSANRTLGTNLRFRWEYQPGSELFVVYNDARDTRLGGFPGVQSRAVIVKINRLFRF